MENEFSRFDAFEKFLVFITLNVYIETHGCSWKCYNKCISKQKSQLLPMTKSNDVFSI